MKIRQGFVSNSSTSSFVALGRYINNNDKQDVKLPEPGSGQDILVFGEGYEARSIICCRDAAMLNYCKRHLADECWMLAHVWGYEGLSRIDSVRLPETFDAEFGEADQSSEESVEALIEHYGPEGATAEDYEPVTVPSGEVVCVKKRRKS